MCAEMNTHVHTRVVRIDVDREKVLSFAEAARFVGKLKGTRRVAFQTLHRWATKGCRGVVLETIFVGGARCTSTEALQRFFAALTAVRQTSPAAGPPTTGPMPTAPEPGDIDAILRNAGISDDDGAEQ